MSSHRKVAQTLRGRVSDPRLAALSGSQTKAPGFAGGYLQVFDTVLDSEIPIGKIRGSRPAEWVRRLVVAPPVRYACDDG
jgi:hypothetical protein